MSTQQRRERERQSRRREILEAAKEVFWERGFQNATIEKIAQRAELAVGTLYCYFQSKEEMYVSLLFESVEIFRKELERIRALAIPPDKKLQLLWNFLYTYYQEYPAYYRILTFLHNEGLRDAVSPELIDEINRRTGHNFSLAADIVREGVEAGIYKADNPREVVDVLWALLVGLVQLMDIRHNLGLKVGALADLHSKAFQWIENGLRKRDEPS